MKGLRDILYLNSFGRNGKIIMKRMYCDGYFETRLIDNHLNDLIDWKDYRIDAIYAGLMVATLSRLYSGKKNIVNLENGEFISNFWFDEIRTGTEYYNYQDPVFGYGKREKCEYIIYKDFRIVMVNGYEEMNQNEKKQWRYRKKYTSSMRF